MRGALQLGASLMTTPPLIRRWHPGEAPALFEVYFSAIHLVASRHYTPEQVQAWAPPDVDPALWAKRMQGINPFVAEWNGTVVAYGDLQPSGLIDHFFVSGRHGRLGVGTCLMNHLLQEARAAGLQELTSDVSRAAQGFYARFGFTIVEQQQPMVRGVVVPNARMRLRLG